jgi:hypothetical protein
MLEKLSQSSGNVVGYKVIGRLTKEDFAAVTADVEALVLQEGPLRLLLDLEAFEGEEMDALGSHRGFRHEHQRHITRMAVVGDKKWQEWVMAFVDLVYYARENRFYPIDQRQAAWEWLRA